MQGVESAQTLMTMAFRVQERGCAVIASVFLGLSVLLYLGITTNRPISYLLISGLVLATALPLVRMAMRAEQRSFDMFEPIYPIAFLYFLYFALRALFILNSEWDPRLEFDQTLNTGLLYVTVGVVVMVLGYYSALPRLLASQLPALDFRPNCRRIEVMIYALWLVSTLMRLYVASQGYYARWVILEVAPLVNAISYLGIFLGRCAYILALVYYLSNRRTSMFVFLWCILLPTEVGWNFVGGEKKLLMFALIAPVAAHHYLRRKASLSRLAATLGLVFFVIFPVVTAYRSVGTSFYEGRDGTDLAQLVGAFGEGVTASYSAGEFGTSLEQIVWRFPGIDALSVIIKSVPEFISLQWGASIFSKVAVGIPKFILESKDDLIKQGSIFNRDYFGQWVHSDLPITQIGELYLNFHVPGIIAGMFMLGVFYRTVYAYFMKCGHSLKYFIYIPIWFGMMNIEGDVGIVYGDLARQLVILLIIGIMLGMKRGVFARRRHVMV